MLCFSMIRVSGQSKSRPVKAAGAEVRCSAEKAKIARRCGETHILKSKCTKHVRFGALFEVEMSKNCTPLWRNAHFASQNVTKHLMSRSTFWSSDVEKLHAAVAKRTFASQNVQNTSCLEHFLKFWCRKIARRCGETHICKSKCTKHLMSRSTFWSSDVEKLHAAVAKRTFTSQNVKKLTVSEHFLKFWCRKIARRCGAKHILKWKCTKYLCSAALFEVLMSKNQSVSKFVSQSISQVVN